MDRGVAEGVEEAVTQGDRSTAYHEAGHAIAAALLGFRVAGLSVRVEGESAGRCRFEATFGPEVDDNNKAFRLALVAYAGLVAEMVRFRVESETARADMNVVAAIACEYFGDDDAAIALFIDSVERAALEMFANEMNLQALDALVTALLPSGTLSSHEVDCICGRLVESRKGIR